MTDLAAQLGVTDPDMAASINASAAPDESPPIRNLADYLAADLSAPPELVAPKMLVKGGITVTVADGGTGKTSMALNRILCWAAGLSPWPITPYTPVAPIKTLVIENEGAGRLFQDKIRDMLGGIQRADLLERLDLVKENTLVWGDGGYAGIHLDEPRWYTQVARGIDEHRPDVVFIEPFARLGTFDENSNTEVNAFVSMLEELAAKYETAVYLCHHKAKGWTEDPLDLQYKSRGASALADASTYFEFMRVAAGGAERELDCTKNKFDDRPGPFRCKWREDSSGWYDFISQTAKLDQVVKALGDDGATTEEVAFRIGDKRGPERADRTIQWLMQAADEGKARQVKHAGEVRWFAGAADKEGVEY